MGYTYVTYNSDLEIGALVRTILPLIQEECDIFRTSWNAQVKRNHGGRPPTELFKETGSNPFLNSNAETSRHFALVALPRWLVRGRLTDRTNIVEPQSRRLRQWIACR